LSFVIWFVIQRSIGMRVTEEEEVLGLDLAEMGMEAYPSAHDRMSRVASDPRAAAQPDAVAAYADAS
jgi:hypothetical protein